MRILPIIEQLLTVTSLAGNVEPAQSMTALSDDEIKNDLPKVFVLPGKETGGENALMGGTSQMVKQRFIVMIAADNSIDPTEPLEDTRELVKTALIGYKPFAQAGPIRFVEGSILDVSKRVIWWIDTYELPTALCSLS
jgi:hypothetical protein